MRVKMGRRKLPVEEKTRRRKESQLKSREKERKLIAAGLCRQCGEPRSSKSKVFCDKHLNRHTENCRMFIDASGEAYIKFRRLSVSAKIRGIPFTVNKQSFVEWLNLQSRKCYYCGVEESILSSNKDRKQKKLTVDRKDNSIGYVEDNLCLACFRCNNLKSNFFTSEEWMEIATKIIRPRIKEYHNFDNT